MPNDNPQLPNREAVIQRPDWWRPGLHLPHLSASTEYTGKGMLNSGGKVTVTRSPVRWESVAEWRERLALIPSPDQGEATAKPDAGVERLIAEWGRLEKTWHDALPQVQGDGGDGGEAGREMCQFLYEHSEELRAALATPPVDSAKPGEVRYPDTVTMPNGDKLHRALGEKYWTCTSAAGAIATNETDDELAEVYGLDQLYAAALSASLPEPQLGVDGDGVRRLRAAAERACDWFELALGDGDAGTDFLNEGGWDDTPSIAENLRSALTVTSKEGV